MGDIGRVLYTAQQAILSNLSAINVTGANISNVNTEGYTRLRPIFEAVGSGDSTSSRDQIGVKIADIERVYDRFLDAQIVSQNSSVGNATARKDLLTQIEGILNESTGSGVNDALSAFWSAWDDLSANPSGQAERDTVISAAENLAYIFNQRADEILTIQHNADQTIADDVDKLNGYLNDMSSLNAQIATAESAGGTASALRDNRTALLGKISSMIDINYVEQSDGSLYIYLPESGKALVQGTNDWQLKAQRNTSNLYDIVFADNPSTSLNAEITGGELGGLLNIRDVVLPSYIDELNQTASSIINKVNSQHTAGYDQDGNIGGLFFEKTTQAKDMAVSDAIIADIRKIAASSTVNADGDNAAAMSAIQDDNIYASLGQISEGGGATGSATGVINNIGQAYKDTLKTLTSSVANTAGATAISSDTKWNEISSANVLAGTSFTVTGKKHDGTAVSGSFEITDTGRTVQDLLDSINTLFGASVASIDSAGKLKIQDTVAGESSFSFNMTTNNPAGGDLDFGAISTTGGIQLTRIATGWQLTDNGGYIAASILPGADDKSITLDLNGDKTADITLNLSGTWADNNTISFSLIKEDSTTNINGYYSAFIARVGQDVSSSATNLAREQAIAAQKNEQREQLSGVSLDEEMLNLIKYQMAYNAASRMTKTISDMMDILINLGQ